jgi:hypothetical protein
MRWATVIVGQSLGQPFLCICCCAHLEIKSGWFSGCLPRRHKNFGAAHLFEDGAV